MAKKANSGSFKPGPDPRRHVLTREERQRGFASFLAKPMSSRLRASIRRKITRCRQGKPPKNSDYHKARAVVYGEELPF